ncbi:WSC-domain-containing protein [Trichocladium antarcticum]|uniref:WSC-domain-containing protein n=1 Tax=Trichocladium antarcticum TaxID=1450529 RepID=A0AAN6UF84_9PEZI|nr:WSC-domain-containing protein [Trichocladium antarcticum]
MSSTGSATGLRAVSLMCLLAVAQALPQQIETRTNVIVPSTRKGCFADKANGHRLLDRASYADDAMTVEACAAFCAGRRHKYFGLEYGRECYCGDDYSGAAVNDSECSFACAGNSGQSCGGRLRLDLYANNLFTPRAPAQLATPYLGCFVDRGSPRTLPDNLVGASDMTAEKCAAHCAAYPYFGVEYGRECWCGHSAPTAVAPESDCSFACAGDDAQLCGAGNRLNAWGPLPTPPTVANFTYAGCFTDQRDARTLTGRVLYDPAMTLAQCAAFCAPYSYFGVEFGSQCYCGTAVANGAAARPQAECAMRCGGEHNMCGGADRLSVFAAAAGGAAPRNPAVAGFAYQSCWAEQGGAARVLAAEERRSDDMTVERCAAVCSGFKYFGLEYARECYCGNELVGGAAAPEEQCSYLCMGDAGQWCGAPDRLNVYVAVEAAAPAATVPAGPVTTVA